jgi:homoserine O-succinyltransferase/O-acetyltransferase
MPLLLDMAHSGSMADPRDRNCLTIGLVNNMPDAACEATERQFLDLLCTAATDAVVRLELFSIAEIRSANDMRPGLAGRYRDIGELWGASLDGLIVTGAEPRAVNLQDEPYWPTLAKLVDWARSNTTSTIWSCLAAHAAVLHADGIERRPVEKKISGVFTCEAVGHHPLLANIASPIQVPHSRLNDLPEPVLASRGYRVLTHSRTAGVDTFVKDDGRSSLFVYFQGHPEYAAASLLREYRRDVSRFLRGEHDHYPTLPQHYLTAKAGLVAEEFRSRAVVDRGLALIGGFPMDALLAGIESSWQPFATRLYENWMNHLKDHKAVSRRSAGGLASSIAKSGIGPDKSALLWSA